MSMLRQRDMELSKPLAEIVVSGTADKHFESVVSVPVLVNRKKILKGEELLFFRERPAKRPRAPEAITVQKLARAQANQKGE